MTCVAPRTIWARSSVRSASEFILMSSRLSHWDTTFSCTLFGRCVEVSRYSPTRQGSRECRDRHSVDRTAWATSRYSAAVPSDPRSTTVHRAVGSRSSATSEGCCGSQMLH